MIAGGSKPESHSRPVPYVPCSCPRRPVLGAEVESRDGSEPSFLTQSTHRAELPRERPDSTEADDPFG